MAACACAMRASRSGELKPRHQSAEGHSGAYAWRIDLLSFAGDTALVRLSDQFAGDWYSDDLSLLRIDGTWRIVHKTWYVHPAGTAGMQ